MGWWEAFGHGREWWGLYRQGMSPWEGLECLEIPPRSQARRGEPCSIRFPEEGAGADGQQSRAVLLTLLLTALMNLNG